MLLSEREEKVCNKSQHTLLASGILGKAASPPQLLSQNGAHGSWVVQELSVRTGGQAFCSLGRCSLDLPGVLSSFLNYVIQRNNVIYKEEEFPSKEWHRRTLAQIIFTQYTWVIGNKINLHFHNILLQGGGVFPRIPTRK